MKRLRAVSALCLLLLPAVTLCAASATLASIRRAGVLTCGIDQSEAEFSMNDEHGSRVAFDTDLCRAVAVAIFGAHARTAIKGYPDNDTALQALQRKEVDLVASVSDDLSHDALPGVGFTRPVLFDGQTFLVLRSSGVKHVADLSGKKICFLDGTEAEMELRSWFARRRLTLVAFPFQEEGEMEAAFVTGNCAALSGDLTRLANARTAFGSRSKDYTFLPETISADPLASAYRNDDPEFGSIVAWTENVLLSAEEMDVTSANAAAMSSSADPVVRRLLGSTHELGRPLQLSDNWAAQVIETVGNYGEVFERNLGQASPLNMPRGENNLWTAGGLMLPLPLK